MKTIKTDLAVVGSGLAGLSAALTALNHGMHVIVFEKRPFQGGGISNTPMCTVSVRNSPAYKDRAFKIFMEYNHWNGNAAAVRTWINRSSDIPDFIRSLGIDFLNVSYNPLEELGTRRGYEIGFPNVMHLGDYYRFKAIGKGHGAAVICKKAVDKIRTLGGEVRFSTPMKRLVREGDRITGLVVEDRKTGEDILVEAPAVVIATGSFNNNPEMLMKFCGHKYTDKNCSGDGTCLFNTFNNAQQTGDGQRAVWDVGGAMGYTMLQGHAMVPGPGIVGDNCAWIMHNELRIVQEQAYLWVNRYGKRFICEEQSDNHMAMVTAVENQPGKCAYMIFDQDTLDRMERDGVERAYFIFNGTNLHHVRRQFEEVIAKGNKFVFIAESIKELSEKAGIEYDGLTEQLESYNNCCDNRYDMELAKDALYLQPVRRGPFYAIKVVPGGYHAFGGIRINGKCEIIDEDQRPIRGLYSAGDCCAGELYGNPPIGGDGQSTFAFSLGFACGDNASDYVRQLKKEEDGRNEA